jgi:hypothetical protein
MTRVSQWLVPAVLAAGFGAMVSVTARAQDDGSVRVRVDVTDVVLRSGQPYYRRGNYGPQDRLVVRRDRYGRPTYYRLVPRQAYYGGGYNGTSTVYDPFDYRPPSTRVSCTSTGNCTVEYYDARYDRRGDGGRQWDGRRGNGHGHHDDD